LTVFGKIKSTDPWMDAKLNSMTHKNFFQCFELFQARLAYKFAKSANMTPKNFSQIFSIWISKNAEFDADFEPLKKYQESLHKEI
jgi:hypothetical protein